MSTGAAQDFAHIVPVSLRVTDDIKPGSKLTAFLTATGVAAGWRIGVVLKRGELQADAFSDLILRGVTNPNLVMLDIGRVILYDGIDDIIAIIWYQGEMFQALFSTEQVSGLVLPKYKDPGISPPGPEETDYHRPHMIRRSRSHRLRQA